MATVNKTIAYGDPGGAYDYGTIAAWDADDGGGDGLGNDDCTGTCHDDGGAFDESGVVINFSANSIVLTVDSSDRHTGTAGTGTLMQPSGSWSGTILTIDQSATTVVEWLEIDGNIQYNASNQICVGCPVDNTVLRYLLVHGTDSGRVTYGIDLSNDNSDCYDCIIYRIETDDGARDCYGLQSSSASATVQNVTVHNCLHTGTGINNCICCNKTNGTSNNVHATDAVGDNLTGTVACYAAGGTQDYNLASDDTDNGANSIGADDGVSTADEFTSTVLGSENLLLKAGADAIDAGSDLGTGDGKEIDILGRDRDSEGDTWDIGAHEYVAVAGGNPWYIYANQ